MQKSGFWDNHKKATEISEELSNLKEEVEFWGKLDKEIGELVEIANLAGEDEGLKKEIAEKLKDLEKKLDKEEIKVFLSGKYDKRDAILTIFSGAGGVDAQDWAEMLLRMYLKYAEKHKFKARVMHIAEGQEAGIKNVTLEISGSYAFGHLKREAGVHRLVRLSPFNADNLRQTSFALIEILPDFSEISQIKINPEDLKIDTYKASGPGGQYVNKTESAVRITHIPTGIVVACQSERLQGSNKERAMKLLQIKLFQKQLESQEKEKKEIKGEKISAGWGYQIRSYVLHPYKMVKDLRTGVESSNPDKILDGDLDEFIEAEIKTI
jgi:peptide chain release factor 2